MSEEKYSVIVTNYAHFFEEYNFRSRISKSTKSGVGKREFENLRKKLKEDVILEKLGELLFVPTYDPKWHQQAILLARVLGVVIDKNDIRKVWYSFLLEIRDGSIKAPESEEELIEVFFLNYPELFKYGTAQTYPNRTLSHWDDKYFLRLDEILWGGSERRGIAIYRSFEVDLPETFKNRFYSVIEKSKSERLNKVFSPHFLGKTILRLRGTFSHGEYSLFLEEIESRKKMQEKRIQEEAMRQAVMEKGVGPLTSAAVSLLYQSVEMLDFTVRTNNFLRAESILRVGDLVLLNEVLLLKIPGMGKKAVIEVKDALARKGLQLGCYDSKIVSELMKMRSV